MEYEGIGHKGVLTVKEFSVFTGVAQTTLRYWDEIGLFRPERRNPENGYRYYSPFQIIAINFVNVLSAIGLPLKAIGDVAKERTPEKILEMLEAHEKRLDMEMRRLRESYSIIHARSDMIRLGLREDVSEISVQTLEEAPVILGPRNDFGNDDDFYRTFMEFCDQAGPLRINLNYPIGAYFDTMDSFVAAPGKPEHFFTVEPTGFERREAGDYLVGYSRGYYADMKDLPERMVAYADGQGLSFHGPAYVIYLHDEVTMTDHEQFLARVIVGVSAGKGRK